MGVYAKVGDARATQGGRWFDPGGEYVVQVQRVKSDKTRLGVVFFVVECKIVESNKDTLPERAEASWMVTLDKDAALGNINEFVCKATGCEPHEVDEAGIEQLIGQKQPLAGHLMRLSTYNKPTKAGKPFTHHKWAPLNETEQQTFAEKVKSLGM